MVLISKLMKQTTRMTLIMLILVMIIMKKHSPAGFGDLIIHSIFRPFGCLMKIITIKNNENSDIDYDSEDYDKNNNDSNDDNDDSCDS